MKTKKGKTVADTKPSGSEPEQAAVGTNAAPAQPRTIGLGVRLVPAGDSDQPRVANYTALTLAPGMAFIDFGFFEPAMLAALPRVAQHERALAPRELHQRGREVGFVRLAKCDLQRIPLVGGAAHLRSDHAAVDLLHRPRAKARLDHGLAGERPRVQRAAHALADHIE